MLFNQELSVIHCNNPADRKSPGGNPLVGILKCTFVAPKAETFSIPWGEMLFNGFNLSLSFFPVCRSYHVFSYCHAEVLVIRPGRKLRIPFHSKNVEVLTFISILMWRKTKTFKNGLHAHAHTHTKPNQKTI